MMPFPRFTSHLMTFVAGTFRTSHERTKNGQVCVEGLGIDLSEAMAAALLPRLIAPELPADSNRHQHQDEREQRTPERSKNVHRRTIDFHISTLTQM